MANNFRYGPRGVALTKSFERLELVAYPDEGGVWTIGWGHTGPGVSRGMHITAAIAEQILLTDLAAAIACVNEAITVPLTQHQFDALVDFTFNAGRTSLLHSSLLRVVNAGRFAQAPAHFRLWIDCAGEPSPGLLRRRNAEIALFNLAPDPAPAPAKEIA